MEMIQTGEPTFGFHGFFNFPRALDDAALNGYLALCTPAMLTSPAARQLVRQLYRGGRHRMAMRVIRRRLKRPAGQPDRPRQLAETMRLAAHCLYHWLIYAIKPRVRSDIRTQAHL